MNRLCGRIVLVACLGVVGAGIGHASAAGDEAEVGPTRPTGSASRLLLEDVEYLRGVAADTWACIAHFVEPTTGLPYDTSKRGKHTSVTNLGYYAACCGVATEMGLVSREEATRRVRRVLDAYRRFEKWNGFSQSWNNVRILEPSPDDTMISLLDSANMVAGFVVAGELLPGVRKDVEGVLAGMNWTPFYDVERGRLYGGYDLKRGRIDRGWHIGDYAGDGRMAAFWAVGVGAAPPASWEKLGRETETHFGLTIFRPAWIGGGLFMQAQDGLFLDERSTPAGRSAADYAYAQMLYAERLGLPVWGWSACYAPDGRYLGWGAMEVPVVTPHAAGMAAMYYPHKAAACLRALEARGARAPFVEGGGKHRLGFRDSIDLRDGAVSDLYIPDLDQAMLFLSLANVLENRIVQRAFERHPVVRRGCERISEYGEKVDEAWLRELHRRDRSGLPDVRNSSRRGPARVLVDDFADEELSRNLVGGRVSTWTRDASDDLASARTSLEVRGDGARCLRIDYDVESSNPAYCGVTFGLNHADVSGCDALVLELRGAPERIKVELHGAGGGGATYIRGVRSDKWSRFEISLVAFGGMITDWHDMHRIVLVFEDRCTRPKVGCMWVGEVVFKRVE